MKICGIRIYVRHQIIEAMTEKPPDWIMIFVVVDCRAALTAVEFGYN